MTLTLTDNSNSKYVFHTFTYLHLFCLFNLINSWLSKQHLLYLCTDNLKFLYAQDFRAETFFCASSVAFFPGTLAYGKYDVKTDLTATTSSFDQFFRTKIKMGQL